MKSSGQADLGQRYLEFLDWPEVCAELALRAHSSRGRTACHALPLCATVAEAAERMAEITEAVSILRAGESLPVLEFPEIETHLRAVAQGAPLGPEELRQVADFCEVVAGARRFFGRIQPEGMLQTPRLSRLAAQLGYHEDLVRLARETFDATGELRDGASPELARLRYERDQLASRAREAAERILRSEEFAPYLQDQFVTLREDRFVLPLRASFKSMGLGIVHDTSRTGETVFVEPTALVELNNRLKVAELDIRHESRRILEELATAVSSAAPLLRADRETLTRLDVIGAGARLAQAYGGEPVEIAEEPIVDLAKLRHPLLALRAVREKLAVTANDLVLGEVPGRSSAKAMVVSGPNAGGKTVLLKSVGLAALLARAGLHVPAAPGSRIGFFRHVLADIGDQQSVLGDLSTFSAHLANLAGILESATTVGDEDLLILCDELMVGTHPEQGAALARAMLEVLADTPGLIVVTTHFDSLKALAENDERFRNAGMEYDLGKLRPTFRLKDGMPGRSYALDIAARIGLPENVLGRARSLMDEGSLGLEETLRNLQEREQALERASRDLDNARLDLERAKQELEERTGAERAAAEALTRRERELAMRSREAIEAAVREAREAISEIVRGAKRERSPQAAEAARAALAKKAKEVTAALPEPPPLDLAKLRAALADRSLAGAKRSSKRQAEPSPEAGPAPVAMQSGANTLDLRGQRADDALAELEAFLDRTALEGADTVFVIHGHGTGALRKVVREYLATSAYVARFRAGGAGEGGDGVSVVSLRG
ncbi:MAG: Smr/MutS family protein [Deltaproteobacteria bacterium]|nr:Smr/MutS family protein [Deltaproteobacteria bacterium]